MVAQHYRWDFIGLSTDTKPTPQTSEKVVDGSTFYCSDNSKLYVFCKDNWYERKPLGEGGGTSDFEDLTNRPKYNNVTMDGSTNIPEVINTDFVGTDGTSAGSKGLVPAPATSDAGKFLKADGTWDTAGGSSVTVVQTTGNSTTDVMSQDATTKMIYPDTSAKDNISIWFPNDNGIQGINIGRHNTFNSGQKCIAIGHRCTAGNASNMIGCVAIGGTDTQHTAIANGSYSVAIGAGSFTNKKGVFAIGGNTTFNDGYNNSHYRLLTGLYDGQDLHDGATVAQGNTLATSAPTTSTVGVLGQLYTDTTNMHTYQCTAISGDTYTWTQRW